MITDNINHIRTINKYNVSLVTGLIFFVCCSNGIAFILLPLTPCPGYRVLKLHDVYTNQKKMK